MQLAGFAATQVKDYATVRNGLNLPYSSRGGGEDNARRLKTVKR
jgi:hypothetical protein